MNHCEIKQIIQKGKLIPSASTRKWSSKIALLSGPPCTNSVQLTILHTAQRNIFFTIIHRVRLQSSTTRPRTCHTRFRLQTHATRSLKNEFSLMVIVPNRNFVLLSRINCKIWWFWCFVGLFSEDELVGIFVQLHNLGKRKLLHLIPNNNIFLYKYIHLTNNIFLI